MTNPFHSLELFLENYPGGFDDDSECVPIHIFFLKELLREYKSRDAVPCAGPVITKYTRTCRKCMFCDWHEDGYGECTKHVVEGEMVTVTAECFCELFCREPDQTDG